MFLCTFNAFRSLARSHKTKHECARARARDCRPKLTIEETRARLKSLKGALICCESNGGEWPPTIGVVLADFGSSRNNSIDDMTSICLLFFVVTIRTLTVCSRNSGKTLSCKFFVFVFLSLCSLPFIFTSVACTRACKRARAPQLLRTSFDRRRRDARNFRFCVAAASDENAAADLTRQTSDCWRC